MQYSSKPFRYKAAMQAQSPTAVEYSTCIDNQSAFVALSESSQTKQKAPSENKH